MWRFLLLVCSAGSACSYAGVATGIDIANLANDLELLDSSGLNLELNPTIPDMIEQDEAIPVELRLRWKSGEICRFCEVLWHSSAPAVASWREPDPPCRLGRCAILEGRSPGEAWLVIVACPNKYRDCHKKQLRVRVSSSVQ